MKRFILYALLLACFQSQARILHVPAEYATIQAGIWNADNGDTVLVSPGTYTENIVFNWNGVRLGSLFMTTGDTSYIGQTIIKPKTSGAIITLMGDYSSSTLISGFTITQAMSGGAISLSDASPTISDCRLIGNTSQEGGGISIYLGTPILRNLVIQNNYAYLHGGGVYLYYSDARFLNVSVINNRAPDGAGLYLSDYSDPMITGLLVSGNKATGFGGGLYFDNSGANLANGQIMNNEAKNGGGFYLASSGPLIAACVVRGNKALYGGGFYFSGSGWVPRLQKNSVTGNTAVIAGGGFNLNGNDSGFSATNLNSVFGNHAPLGNDFYRFDTTATDHIQLDTFSVRYPTDYYAEPYLSFDITMQHHMTEQVESDLYVSAAGSDTSSGLSAATPLRTVDRAFSFLRLDSARRFTVHVAYGVYSPSLTGETFPVCIPDYASLEGESKEGVIFRRKAYDPILWFHHNHDNRLSRCTFQEGGILCEYANPRMDEIDIQGTLTDTVVTIQGGGISLNNARASLRDVTISGFRASCGGGFFAYLSTCSADNFRINRCAASNGGAIALQNSAMTMRNAEVTGNSAFIGGIMETWFSTAAMTNSTFAGNISACNTGAFYLRGTDLSFTNTIVRDDSIPEFICDQYGGACDLTFAWSDIRGGDSAVMTNGTGTVHWLDGNIDRDPVFAGTLSPRPFSIDRNSPCRDAGTPDTAGLSLPSIDLAGGPRVWNGRVDMGAYEWNSLSVREHPKNRFTAEVFPNPFHDEFAVRYHLASPGMVRISILDSQGRTIKELPPEREPAGVHELDLDGRSLPDGVCFVKVSSDEGTVVKKAVQTR